MKAYINEVRENYGCPPILHNCDEVLEFLFKTYKHPYCDGEFLLSIIIVSDRFDQMPGIVLPGHVREEIIATAKGEY